MKQIIHKTFGQLLTSETQQTYLNSSMKDLSVQPPILKNVNHGYFSVNTNLKVKERPIFITSRFRAGSTLLWNLFRDLPNTRAFYEPFNERQWFNPDLRGGNTDNTHLGVTEYWAEYSGLEHLKEYYSEQWHKRYLLMDRYTSMPDMYQYIQALLHASKERSVLQFNRVDFRLDWLKSHFPQAILLHLYRHPRAQWISFLRTPNSIPFDKCELHYVDHFYLNSWCENLSQHFPFLSQVVTPHPYERFYLLWKLSYLFGQKYADLSLSYEELVNGTSGIENLAKLCGLDMSEVTIATAKIEPQKNMDKKWQNYAPVAWYEELESSAEFKISNFSRNL